MEVEEVRYPRQWWKGDRLIVSMTRSKSNHNVKITKTELSLVYSIYVLNITTLSEETLVPQMFSCKLLLPFVQSKSYVRASWLLSSLIPP